MSRMKPDKKFVSMSMNLTPELYEKLKFVQRHTTLPIATMARTALIEKYSDLLERAEVELVNESEKV